MNSLGNNPLLLQFMKVCPIPNYYLEKKFIQIRKEILNQIYKLNFEKVYIKFLISLSIQCYLNEFIYEKSQEEIKKIKKIKEKIKNNLNNNKKINDLEILCLSCYEPLSNISLSNKINFSNELYEIFEIHLKQKEREKEISESIKSISIVKNKVSKNVKNQYEENPYPRWVNLGLSFESRNMSQVINESELNLDFKKLNFQKILKFLSLVAVQVNMLSQLLQNIKMQKYLHLI